MSGVWTGINVFVFFASLAGVALFLSLSSFGPPSARNQAKGDVMIVLFITCAMLILTQFVVRALS